MGSRKKQDPPPSPPPGEDTTAVDFSAALPPGAEGPPEMEAAPAAATATVLPAAEEEAAPPEPKETCKEYLRRNFTAEELLLMGRKMGQAHQELVRLNEDLASIKADFKSRITNKEGEISNYSRMLNAGHEMANIECEVVRDHKDKMVRIYRLDTGDFVRERRMTLDEQQRSLLPPETEAEVAAHFGVESPPPASTEGAAAGAPA